LYKFLSLLPCAKVKNILHMANAQFLLKKIN
jgi:hypothetical protein